MSRMIKAVTFDLWDTIVHDDSDEPKRKAKGLRTKKAERRQEAKLGARVKKIAAVKSTQ